ncbi:hypothetical protein DPMN_012489 [Dreissena polymorpha]|uniref:Uncharacterized protein n=1 Tax=Dreissena polymorpha TaxID=45954 RepID=A0A9D4N743_DREPO|nr:hypothetical protein DPMN_012489 [Dreissena polymorpha]
MWHKIGLSLGLCFVFAQVDVELAKTEANKPEEDVELKKKLWLRIGEWKCTAHNLCLLLASAACFYP